MKLRSCRRCGDEKKLSDFCKDSRSQDGYRWTCLTCYRKQVQERYERQKKETMTVSPTVAVNGRKMCGVCREVLPVSRFYKDAQSRSGWRWQCRACTKKQAAGRREKPITGKLKKFPPFKGYGLR